jgi:hypothetical protein
MDGRTIEIGARTHCDGGWNFKNPHLNNCFLATDFSFAGYDAIYILPTLSTAKLHGSDEEPVHQLAKENLVIEMSRILKPIFPNVVTREEDIKPGERVLKLENTIIEYAKGGGAARYWAGLFGGGQPVLLVQGKITDGDRTVFSYQGRRSGVSAAARIGGAYLRDEDIQLDDIRSLALDVTDFIAAITGKYQHLN